MKNAIIILMFIFSQWLNAQEIDTLFNNDVHIPFVFIEGSNAYLDDATIYVKHKIINKFEKEVENIFDDEFLAKTPAKLWDNDKRFYLITLNNKGGYHLFVVSESVYGNFKINDYFQFIIFGPYGGIFSDLGRFNKQEVSQFFK